ncbi:cation:proton antiporter [bacterium]|nr:cation:proton antiporter [bacterium]
MHGQEMASIAIIFFLAISAQWLGWKFRIPSIILLLVFGFFAGPISGMIDPDHLLGDLLSPFVSLAVAMILFEGGLSLRFAEIPGLRRVIFSLISIGMLTTWIVGAWAAREFLGLGVQMALLLGAILTVSGPTVIIPLLRDIRPKPSLSSILKWEGILIDPIGALFAVLLFEVMIQGELLSAPMHIAGGVLKTVVVGGVAGILGSVLLIYLIKRYLIPDYLQNPFSFSLVILVFVTADYFQPESGLFAVTLMGIILANRSTLVIRHIVEFKENLQVLLIGVLFILLSARLEIENIRDLDWRSLLFLLVMVFVARPLSVLFSTAGSGLSWRERLFLSWMAPRGIVAAAVASLFGLQLEAAGFEGGELLVSYTFLIIVGAGFLYGLTAGPVARLLGVQQKDAQGVLFLGAHQVARELAKQIQLSGFKVLLVDTNWGNISAAKLDGLPAHYGNILSEHIDGDVDLDGIGKLFALTPNNEANSLAALRFAELFGRAGVFQLSHDTKSSQDSEKIHPKHLRGRFLFDKDQHYNVLHREMREGAVIKTISISEEFPFEKIRENYEALFIPLILIDDERFDVMTQDLELDPKPGQKIIALVKE